jgi:hypothetical protein
MNKQKNYVPPGVEICRVEMEAGIADITVMSTNTSSPAQIESWVDDISINDIDTDTGDIYIPWK